MLWILTGSQVSAPSAQQYDSPSEGYANGSAAAQPTGPSAPVPAEQAASAPSQSNKRRDANGRQPSNPVRSATASLENVERAMSDLHVSGPARNGRRAHGEEIQAGNIQVPATDFDFASSNAKFDKAALAKPVQEESDSDSDTDSDVTNPEDAEAQAKKEKERKEKEAAKKESAYNPQKSFFDALTPNSVGGGGPRGGQPGRGGGGGRGRGRGRSRREEEAQRNLLTFGEAIPPVNANGFSRRGGRRGGGGGGGGGYNSQAGMSTGRPR